MPSYILQLVTGTEKKAAHELQTIGLQVICPMRDEVKRDARNRRKVETISVPVLPGYIVISGNLFPWIAIRKLKEVIRPIECGGEPQPISREVVDQIAALEGIEASGLAFALKQRVQVLNDIGEPTGMYGTIAKLLGIKRVELELDKLGTATIEVGKLEAA